MAMKRLSMVVAGGRITPLRLRAAAAPGCSFPPVVSCAARRQDQPILLKSRKGSLCAPSEARRTACAPARSLAGDFRYCRLCSDFSKLLWKKSYIGERRLHMPFLT